MKIRHIATRFALVLALAALVPLVAFGLSSLVTLRRGTQATIVSGHLNVADRAAEEIRRYVLANAQILKALGADLQSTGLAAWQQDRILKNYVLQFREFRELTLFDDKGTAIATSRIGQPHVSVPDTLPPLVEGVGMSPLRLDDDLLPTSAFAIRLTQLARTSGWLVGEFSLEEMWKMVDAIRVGSRGYALVVGPDGSLIAHGNPDRKMLIAQATSMARHPLLVDRGSRWREYVDDFGTRQLGVSAPIAPLNWTVIVEQPTAEAYAAFERLQRQLAIAAIAALMVMLAAGLIGGRRFIAPIFALQRGTQALAAGKLDSRVDIRSNDEFGTLGRSFNAMADRLVALQEDVKRQERQAMFGRVVGGLFHDLSHPIQNIGNNARLILRDDMDADTKRSCQQVIEREMGVLKRFMDDILNIAKPRPLERFPVDVSRSVAEATEAMVAEGAKVQVSVVGDYSEEPLTIDADRFALGRVYRNLLTNAIQATAPGGEVRVVTRGAGSHVEVIVIDTGSGIEPDRLMAIFDDFATTKKRGLGLGLASSKRIVEQLGGTITVESTVGKGTRFTLRFPAASVIPAALAAAR